MRGRASRSCRTNVRSTAVYSSDVRPTLRLARGGGASVSDDGCLQVAGADLKAGPSGLLLRERVGTKLEFHQLARGALSPFAVERRAGGVSGVHALALPTRVRVVDSAVRALPVEPHRVRDAEGAHLPLLNRDDGVVPIAEGKRCVRAQTKGVELVHPRVVRR